MSARNSSARNRKSGLHDNNAIWTERNIDFQLLIPNTIAFFGRTVNNSMMIWILFK